jgi:Zn finger protein HypA/HybF involved in hydrogenase expression
MPNIPSIILSAIRAGDYAQATESVAQALQSKVEIRLAQERQNLARNLVGEANDVKGPLGCDAKHKGGAVCRLKAGHTGKHQATAGDEHYIWEGDVLDFPWQRTSHCTDCGKTWKSRTDPDKCPDCKSPQIHTEPLKEAKDNSWATFTVKCQECGKVFKTKELSPKCPKCGGYDIDLSEAVDPKYDQARKLKEDSEADQAFKTTYGFNKSGTVIFSAPGKLDYAEVHELSPSVKRVEVHGVNYAGLDIIEAGYVSFSIDTYGDRATTQKSLISRLARAGIPAKPGYTPYQDHIGVQVPSKYSKKADRELFG